ncbi:MAG: MFS transporter, partial [Calditrichaeota bacterium]
ATSVTLIGRLLKWVCYDPMAPWKVLLPSPLIAVGMGGLFTLMGSMIADVCDLDELETGERREGMYGSIYWWMVKLGMSLAFALSGFLLNATGFLVELGGQQTESTFFWMRIVDVVIPTVCAAISIITVATFKLTEDTAYEIRAKLEKRRTSHAVESGAV